MLNNTFNIRGVVATLGSAVCSILYPFHPLTGSGGTGKVSDISKQAWFKVLLNHRTETRLIHPEPLGDSSIKIMEEIVVRGYINGKSRTNKFRGYTMEDIPTASLYREDAPNIHKFHSLLFECSMSNCCLG